MRLLWSITHKVTDTLSLIFEIVDPATLLALLFARRAEFKVVGGRVATRKSHDQLVYMADVFMGVASETVLQTDAASSRSSGLADDPGVRINFQDPRDRDAAVSPTLIDAEPV